MKIGIIQHKIDFKYSYDCRKQTYNIEIPEREIRKYLFDKPHSKIVDVYFEIVGVESEGKE